MSIRRGHFNHSSLAKAFARANGTAFFAGAQRTLKNDPLTSPLALCLQNRNGATSALKTEHARKLPSTIDLFLQPSPLADQTSSSRKSLEAADKTLPLPSFRSTRAYRARTCQLRYDARSSPPSTQTGLVTPPLLAHTVPYVSGILMISRGHRELRLPTPCTGYVGSL